jgi:uncharacterized protein YndB with AHSA1/START domain
MASFSFTRTIAAPPETVFAILTDHRGYPAFTRLRRVELERPGSPDPDGLGAIRKLHMVGPPMREEIVEFERPTRFAYRLLSGLPLRDHLGRVVLSGDGAGTRIVYTVETTPTVPVIGHAAAQGVKIAVKQLLDGVERESKRRASAS